MTGAEPKACAQAQGACQIALIASSAALQNG